MNITERFFVEALCAFVTENGEKLNTEGVEGKELLALSKRHSVGGIISYVLNRYDLFEDDEISRELSSHYDKTLSVMLRRSLAAENLSRKFSKNNIAHIPFKGSTIASYYPVPELRVYSDVDMIVNEGDLKKIETLMSEKNFERSIADMGVVTCYKKGMEYYEFHTNLNIPDDEKKVFSKIWENAELLEGTSYRFGESFHLCYIVSHLEKHMRAGGAGIKMYLDIALYLKNAKNIDFSLVKEKLMECSLYKFFETVLWLCHKWFMTELPFEITPLGDEVYEELCKFTLSAGVYGDHSKEAGLESALARTAKGSGKCSKLRFVLSRAFPRAGELYRMYPKYEGKPLLLPLAWFTHLFSFLRKDKRKNIKAVLATDVESAVSRRDFLVSLGCKN